MKAPWLLDSELLLGQLDCLDHVDSVPGHTVVSSHFVVHLVEGALDRLGPVLLEHVLVPDVGVVLEVDAVVPGLDLARAVDLLDPEDLSLGLLDLVLGPHDFPELGLGESAVLGDHFDDCDGGLLLSLLGLDPSVDQELPSPLRDAVV